MPVYLFDDANRERLLPFTHTRPVADIRTGIFTSRERWQALLDVETGTITAPHLSDVYGETENLPESEDHLLINAAFLGTPELAEALRALPAGHSLMSAEGDLIGSRTEAGPEYAVPVPELRVIFEGSTFRISRIPDIFSQAAACIAHDFSIATKGRQSAIIPEDVVVREHENIFVEEGAEIGAGVIINAQDGPVYIARDAVIMEGSMLRGPLAVCEGAVIKMGAKIYGGTVIGPGCKIGGEVQNVVFFANSNKGHDGYLGNSVIGEWCNLGADTNCSNLKNNYDVVKIRDEANNRNTATGLTFCGLFMGDHSKCGINTMFNTGTVVGVSCNIWGGGFQEKFIPSFTWGGTDGMTTYTVPRALETASRAMARRGKTLTDAEREMLQAVFDKTAEARATYHRGSGR